MPNKSKKIAIVDYGVGNLHSLVKVFAKFDQKAVITEEVGDILSSDALVLPGVGAFRAGMEGLKIRNLIKPIKEFAKLNKPILGICLGAQLLLSKGYEFGTFDGLDIISGKVVKFVKIKDKIPHIGWNEIFSPHSLRWGNTILNSIKEKSDVYFVHSYILQPDKQSNILAITNYGGYKFCSAIRKGNIYGCQFHPEKSGQTGLQIIKNFVNIVRPSQNPIFSHNFRIWPAAL